MWRCGSGEVPDSVLSARILDLRQNTKLVGIVRAELCLYHIFYTFKYFFSIGIPYLWFTYFDVFIGDFCKTYFQST